MKNSKTSNWLTSSDSSRANASVDERAPTRINVERMKLALAQESISIPMGLSISQKIEFMMNRAGAL